jgi:hypothetical protein
MMFKKSLPLIFLLFLSFILYLFFIVLPPGKLKFPLYFIMLILQFCIYFYILWQTFHHPDKLLSLTWFLIFAGLYRLIFIFYVSASFNPVFIGSEESLGIGPAPAAQMPDWLSLYLKVWPVGTTLFWQLILLIVELLAGFLLYKLTCRFTLSPYRLLIVLLNPLWIIEIYLLGHIQIIGILGLWLAIYLFYLKKDWPALAVVIVSFCVTLIPLLIYLPFLFKKFWPKFILVLSGVALIVFLFPTTGMLSPIHFLSAPGRGVFNGVLISIGSYLFNYFNPGGEGIITINWFGYPAVVYTRPEFYMLLLIVLILLVVVISQAKKLQMTADFRSSNYLQAGYMITGALLLVSPVLHPWHLLWILPFIIFLPNWSWLIFTFLIQFSYLISVKYPPPDNMVVSGWILFLLYVPFYILLIAEYLDKRRIKGWF